MFRIEQANADYVPDDLPSKPMLLWTDPPYGTGKTQKQRGNKFYDDKDTTNVVKSICAWLPYLDEEATVCICCDYRLGSFVINAIMKFGWCYRGEIIWEFGLGRPRVSWWPVRHNNILTFTRTELSGKFDATAIPRAKRLAPKPGYGDDKPSGSVWEYTMSNTDPERVGYPNQKPLKIIEPFVLAHTDPGDLVVDIFAGSSSTGHAALKHGRDFYGNDNNPEAVTISRHRLKSLMRKKRKR